MIVRVGGGHRRGKGRRHRQPREDPSLPGVRRRDSRPSSKVNTFLVRRETTAMGQKDSFRRWKEREVGRACKPLPARVLPPFRTHCSAFRLHIHYLARECDSPLGKNDSSPGYACGTETRKVACFPPSTPDPHPLSHQQRSVPPSSSSSLILLCLFHPFILGYNSSLLRSGQIYLPR